MRLLPPPPDVSLSLDSTYRRTLQETPAINLGYVQRTQTTGAGPVPTTDSRGRTLTILAATGIWHGSWLAARGSWPTMPTMI